jgi:cell division protein FtsQ
VKRRRATPAQRLRPFWFLIASIVVLIAIGFYLFSTARMFYPRAIDVAGNRVVSNDAILAAAQIQFNRNIWLQNTGAMQQRIEAIPFIGTAAVYRHLPSTIVIDVTERTPFAVLDTGGARELVDRTLRVLRAAGPQDAMLPSLVEAPGQDVHGLAEVIIEAQQTQLQPTSVDYDKYGDVEMTMRGGIRVLFGDPNTVDDKMQMIVPILDKVDRGKRRVAAIDLRAATTPVVEYAK